MRLTGLRKVVSCVLQTKRPFLVALVALAIGLLARSAHASTALELVRMAHTHEAAHEDAVAVRRYMEALSLDAACEEAYLGLGSLRSRQGDLREAERVYSVALERMPRLRPARTARAYVRRGLGARDDAITDLLAATEDEVAALRVIATWYAEDGQTPAQLAIWRRIADRADRASDALLLREARATIRALVLLVGPADPAAAPPRDDGARRVISAQAKKGG